MAGAKVDLSFAHDWSAEVLAQRPMILPPRHFTYPQEVEEVERGALEVLVRPAAGEAFLATCALGFNDPAAPSGVWSCPDPRWLCAVAGGYAYLIDSGAPERWEQVEYRPVLGVRALVEQRLLLFIGHHALTAWSEEGRAWQSARLSWEGITVLKVSGNTLSGTGWDVLTDLEVPFELDLLTGEHRGGVGGR